jgi:DNA-binding transcriptional ArsR family regulator
MKKTWFTHKGTPWSQINADLSKDEAAAQGNASLVLRNKTRLRIMHLLKRHGGLLCVSEIAEALEENPSVISNHLALLRAANLVSQEKYQAYVYYTLIPGALVQYQQYLDSLTE